jgi:hypothetical protein
MSARLRRVAPEVVRTAPEPRRLQPRATASLPIVPVACSDLTAPIVFGLESRHYREFLVKNQVPFVRAGQRVIAKVADVVAALDRLAIVQGTATAIAPADDDDTEHAAEESAGDRLLRRLGRVREGGRS